MCKTQKLIVENTKNKEKNKRIQTHLQRVSGVVPVERLHGLDVMDKVGVALDELINLVRWDVIFELG